MKLGRRWLQPLQHGILLSFLLSPSLLCSLLPAVAGFVVGGFNFPRIPSSHVGREESQPGKQDICREIHGKSAENQSYNKCRISRGSIETGRRYALSLVCRSALSYRRQASRIPELRLSANEDTTLPTADLFDKSPDAEIPMEKLDFPHQPPERVPFDLDLAAFLGNFAFEAYRNPGPLAWEVRGASGSEVRFKNGSIVSKVFPGVLTVSLLAVEGLPSFVENAGGENGNNKRERLVNPCVAMVLSDKDMSSETQTSTKRLPPGGRYWGELFSMHVHDPESSILKIWLLDRGDWGPIPVSMRDIFRGAGDQALVGTSKVLLSQVLQSMSRNVEDSWSGWVEMEPLNEKGSDGGDTTDEHAGVRNGASGDSERRPARVQLDLRFAPMDAYHLDVPTAPHPSEAKVPTSKADGWTEFASEIARGVGTFATSGREHPVTSSGDDRSSSSSSSTSRSGRVVSALKTDLREEGTGMREVDAVEGSKRAVELNEDGMPDWGVLTNRLARQPKAFELMCFIENIETDTQVYVWREAARKRLIVAFRGTEAWKDLLTDANFLLDELDRSESATVRPQAGEFAAAAKSTTASWKKERVKPLPETLSQQKETLQEKINQVMDSSMDILRDLRTTSEREDAPAAASTFDPSSEPGSRAEKVLSAVQRALKVGAVEPASASELGGEGVDSSEETKKAAVVPPQSLPGGELEGGRNNLSSGGLLGRLGEVRQKLVGLGGGDGEGVGANSTELALQPGDYGVLANTLAWVQHVAGAQVQAINTVAESATRISSNATAVSETLAQYFKDQQDMIEATRDLVAKVKEFRNDIEGSDGLQEKGRRIIDNKINDLRTMLTNATSTDLVKDTPRIHSGFRNAYVSVNKTLSAVVWGATDGKPEDWHVYVTGHSLGGALGTLAALDHARRYPHARVTMYNYGSPRVGNRAFAKVYDSFVGDSFRVVNNMDVVARLPRGTMGRLFLDYRHAGRTVMVDDNPAESAWIEGESEGGCPLDEDDPVTMVLGEGSKATEFLDYEIKIMEALLSGKGIDHHLQPCYFAALDSFYTEEGGTG